MALTDKKPNLIGILQRRWGLVIGPIILGALLGASILSLVSPRYHAEVIWPLGKQAVEILEHAPRAELLANIYRTANLAQSPEFNLRLPDQRSVVNHLSWYIQRLGISAQDLSNNASLQALGLQELDRRLRIEFSTAAQTVKLTVWAGQARLAARILTATMAAQVQYLHLSAPDRLPPVALPRRQDPCPWALAAFCGAAVGLMMGIILARWREKYLRRALC